MLEKSFKKSRYEYDGEIICCLVCNHWMKYEIKLFYNSIFIWYMSHFDNIWATFLNCWKEEQMEFFCNFRTFNWRWILEVTWWKILHGWTNLRLSMLSDTSGHLPRTSFVLIFKILPLVPPLLPILLLFSFIKIAWTHLGQLWDHNSCLFSPLPSMWTHNSFRKRYLLMFEN